MTDKYCPLRFREFGSQEHDQRCIGEYCAWFDKCSQSHGEPRTDTVETQTRVCTETDAETAQEPREADEKANDADSREKLEADVQKFSQVYYTSHLLVYDKVIELLDRQEAITEREFIHSHPICGGSDTCHATNLLNSESVERETPQTAENATSKDEIRDFDVWSVAYEIYCAGGWVDNGNEPNPPTDGIWKLLDRQAAITELECIRRLEGRADYMAFAYKQADEERKRLSNQVEGLFTVRDDLQARVDELTAERDELKVRISELEKQWDARDSDCIALEAKVNRLEDEITDWSELHAQVLSERNHVIAERDELKRQLDTMRDVARDFRGERDLWNKRYSQSYDYALDLQAQLDEAKAKPDCDCCEWQEENAKLRSQVEMLVSDGLLAAYLRHCERIDELQAQLDKLSSDELHWRSEVEFWRCKYELIAKAVNDVARNYVDVEDEGLA